MPHFSNDLTLNHTHRDGVDLNMSVQSGIRKSEQQIVYQTQYYKQGLFIVRRYSRVYFYLLFLCVHLRQKM